MSCTLNKACVAVNEDVDNAVGPRDIIETIDSIGYHAELVNIDTNNRVSDGFEEIRHWGNLLLVALIFGVPIMFLHLSMGSIPFVKALFMEPGMCGGSVSKGQTAVFLMSLPMQFGVGNHLLTYLLTYSLTRSLTHSLTHSLTRSLTHSLTHSFTSQVTSSIAQQFLGHLTVILAWISW